MLASTRKKTPANGAAIAPIPHAVSVLRDSTDPNTPHPNAARISTPDHAAQAVAYRPPPSAPSPAPAAISTPPAATVRISPAATFPRHTRHRLAGRAWRYPAVP